MKILILKAIFAKTKRKAKNIDLYKIAQIVSRKKIITVNELKEELNQMSENHFIDFVAKTGEKGYTYSVKLKEKGEYFLKKEENKLGDFFVGVFIYTLLIVLVVFLIFIFKKLRETF